MQQLPAAGVLPVLRVSRKMYNVFSQESPSAAYSSLSLSPEKDKARRRFSEQMRARLRRETRRECVCACERVRAGSAVEFVKGRPRNDYLHALVRL